MSEEVLVVEFPMHVRLPPQPFIWLTADLFTSSAAEIALTVCVWCLPSAEYGCISLQCNSGGLSPGSFTMILQILCCIISITTVLLGYVL